MKPEHVRRAVAKSREARLRRMEQVVGGHLRFLRRHDRDAYEAFMGMLRRVVGRQTSQA